MNDRGLVQVTCPSHNHRLDYNVCSLMVNRCWLTYWWWWTPDKLDEFGSSFGDMAVGTVCTICCRSLGLRARQVQVEANLVHFSEDVCDRSGE